MDDPSKSRPELPDAVKIAVLDSSVITELKQAVYLGKVSVDDTDTLKGKAEAMADDIQHMIDSNILDDADLQKCSAVLVRLRGALTGGAISREALAMALSEASGAIASVTNSKIPALHEKEQLLWQQVEQYNKAINDDFKKMQQAGITFEDELWEKHQRLLDYLQEHPRDIEKQKELNAVDDLLLEQAEGQLTKYPNAKLSFEHAKKESEARHQAVDKQLSLIEKKNQNLELDWDSPVTVSMDDVQAPIIGKNPTTRENTIS